jgi:uncharacterized protein
MRSVRKPLPSDGLRRPLGLSRRDFLETAAWIAGGSLVLTDPAFPESLFAPPFGLSLADPKSGQRIAATPTYLYRPYRSRPAKSPDAVSWVQIDLGAVRRIDSVKLYPANQRLTLDGNDHYAGEGFPVRFKIEASEAASFSRPKTIADQTGADFENPKDGILSFPAIGLRARYVRLTVNKLDEPQCQDDVSLAPEARTKCSPLGKFSFAVSKIAVLSAGKDIAVGQPATADEVYGNPGDLAQLTRQERFDTEYVHRDRPDNLTDPGKWARVPYAAQAPLSGVTLQGGLFETVMRNNIRYLLDSYTLDDLLLQFRQRAGKPIPPSTRRPDQFWEEDLAGSNAGRFLMGAGNTLRWIDDPELRNRLNALVEGIAECREPNGWVMAFPEDTMFFSERGAYTRAWLTHGLIEAGYAGNTKAFALLRGNYDWFNQCQYLPDLLRGAVQGGQGMIANTRMYFTPVGKPSDIQVIQRYFLEDESGGAGPI